MSANLVPNLGYRDAPAAIRFLVAAFGFEEAAVYDREDGSVGHAHLRSPGGGGVTLYSAEHEGNSIADLAAWASRAGGYPAFTVHVTTDEPDGLFARAVAAGATVVRVVADSPLGTRGFVVCDPEGLFWSCGTPLPRLVRDRGGAWRPPAGDPTRASG